MHADHQYLIENAATLHGKDTVYNSADTGVHGLRGRLPRCCRQNNGAASAAKKIDGRGVAAVLPDRLRAGDLPIIHNATCAEVYPGRIADGQVYAGYAQGTKDSWEGDSGGPRVVPGGLTCWTQPGVVSFGSGRAQPGA